MKSFEDFHKANITLTRNREFGYEFMDKISYMIDKREPDHNSNDHDIINDIVDQPRSANDSTLAICEAKLGKASVIDMIPVEFYKLGGETIFNTMLAIFNSVLQSRDYFQAWVDGIINPIYKMEKQSKLGNYQKITFRSSLRKLFGTVMNHRLCFVEETLRIENLFQNGFNSLKPSEVYMRL